MKEVFNLTYLGLFPLGKSSSGKGMGIKMQITDVRIRKIAKVGKMRAVASITLEDEFVVHDIKVIEGDKGLFIAMPSKKMPDGEYRDIAHPINTSYRENIEKTILESYARVMEQPDEL